jgi:metal-sulfur cluster biosynthetic enzyme
VVFLPTQPALPVDAIRSALMTVEDPELGLDIVSLGLVYEIACDEGHARIVYSLTSMGCPIGPMIERDIVRAASTVSGVQDVEAELVFDPPWSHERMTDGAKFLLGAYN